MTKTLAFDLWYAIDRGDDGAYDALIDYYLESGLDKAADGVRRAKPHWRRPIVWSDIDPDPFWRWIVRLGNGDTSRSGLSVYRPGHGRVEWSQKFPSQEAAWAWLADWNGEIVTFLPKCES